MKNRNNKRNEFYVYKVIRKNENGTALEENNVVSPEKPDKNDYVLSPHFGKQEYKKKYDSMGYHRDPSSYDFIRGDKNLRLETYKKHIQNNYNQNQQSQVEPTLEEEVIEPDKAKEGLLFYLEMLYNTINAKKQVLIGIVVKFK